jgi:hypothetical protein
LQTFGSVSKIWLLFEGGDHRVQWWRPLCQIPFSECPKVKKGYLLGGRCDNTASVRAKYLARGFVGFSAMHRGYSRGAITRIFGSKAVKICDAGNMMRHKSAAKATNTGLSTLMLTVLESVPGLRRKIILSHRKGVIWRETGDSGNRPLLKCRS